MSKDVGGRLATKFDEFNGSDDVSSFYQLYEFNKSSL
jgi:hypothetical protein